MPTSSIVAQPAHGRARGDPADKFIEPRSGVVTLTYKRQNEVTSDCNLRSSGSVPDACFLTPIPECLSANHAIVADVHQMAPWTNVAIDKGMGEQETLSLTR